MLLPPSMRNQDPQPSQPFGERLPRPDEKTADAKPALPPVVNGIATDAHGRKRTALPDKPLTSTDIDMIKRDLVPMRNDWLQPHLEAFTRSMIEAIRKTLKSTAGLALLRPALPPGSWERCAVQFIGVEYVRLGEGGWGAQMTHASRYGSERGPVNVGDAAEIYMADTDRWTILAWRLAP